jgi:UDP-N-acetylmuramate: L-alanyl-gamma-D-glutamyl-meso-diaminopimelate ligase
MAGVALIAKQMGFEVSGQDEKVYPPMSTLLKNQGIALTEGYEVEGLPSDADMIVVGNAMKRGMPVIEAMLNQSIDFLSGPEWLYQQVLKHKRVIAISGTHGKTTTSALVAWLLETGGLNPGFLIGGVLENFGVSARLTESDYFVIEADEYDTAFFDKRAKFVHYHPEWLSINNIEFDHADIYENLSAILRQFHGVIRTLPSKGMLLRPSQSEAADTLIEKGCWTPVKTFGQEGDWLADKIKEDGSAFSVSYHKAPILEVNWALLGEHNIQNALVAVALMHEIGLPPDSYQAGFASFKSVKRRLELKGKKNGVTLYDDFAHHPTAIASTLKGLRAHVGADKIIVLLECGSFTMREGKHGEALYNALALADEAYILNNPNKTAVLPKKIVVCESVDEILSHLKKISGNVHIVTMSNKGFEHVHEKLLSSLP